MPERSDDYRQRYPFAVARARRELLRATLVGLAERCHGKDSQSSTHALDWRSCAEIMGALAAVPPQRKGRYRPFVDRPTVQVLAERREALLWAQQ